MIKSKNNICVIGLGYVGMPLAYEFSKHFNVIGFDINKQRIGELKKGIDKNDQIISKNLIKSKIKVTHKLKDLSNIDIFIVTVPTPIKKNKQPDLTPLINSTKIISKKIRRNNIVIYESTMYPGLTEEILVPLIEKISFLKYNEGDAPAAPEIFSKYKSPDKG